METLSGYWFTRGRRDWVALWKLQSTGIWQHSLPLVLQALTRLTFCILPAQGAVQDERLPMSLLTFKSPCSTANFAV